MQFGQDDQQHYLEEMAATWKENRLSQENFTRLHIQTLDILCEAATTLRAPSMTPHSIQGPQTPATDRPDIDRGPGTGARPGEEGLVPAATGLPEQASTEGPGDKANHGQGRGHHGRGMSASMGCPPQKHGWPTMRASQKASHNRGYGTYGIAVAHAPPPSMLTQERFPTKNKVYYI